MINFDPTPSFQKYINYLSIPFFTYIVLITIFGRTFNGLYIGGFRLGELVVGLAIVMTFLSILTFKKQHINKSFLYLFIGLLLSFFVSAIFSNSNFTETYTYKSSSIIWTTSFIFFGGLIFKSKFTDSFIKYLFIFSPLTYIFTIVFFPNPLWNFFKLYSDKFDYLKSSDILLTYILLNFLTKRNIESKKITLTFFLLSSALIAPLLSFMSRGAFLAFLIYFISEVFLIRKLVLKNKLKFLFTLILATLIFALSTIIITTDIDFEFLNFGKKIEIVEDQNVLASGRAEVVARQLPIVFVEREFFGTTLSIFYQDGRFYSTEVTANWRLQLWQDVIEDVVNKGRLFIGYGYSEIIPAMTDPLNNGNDSTNENLHNYFVQVFARGGLLQLIIVILIIFTYISIWVKQKNNYKILQFVIPIIVVSVFDPTLETVRFPLIYYSFLGYFLSDKKVYS